MSEQDKKMPPESSGKFIQKPKCLALILCEQVIEDKKTHNKSLIGLFSRISAKKVPVIYPRFYIMASLTGGRGTVPAEITIEHLGTSKSVIKLSGQAAFRDPLSVTDVVLECRNVPFKEKGVYVITIFCSGQPIAERRFELSLQAPKKA